MGQISPVQTGGVDNIMQAEALLSALPLTLDHQGYETLAMQGLDRRRVLGLLRLLRQSGRTVEVETVAGRRVSRRGV